MLRSPLQTFSLFFCPQFLRDPPPACAGGSVQLNFLLLALAELPSTLLVAACVDVVGRVALLVAGVAMAAGTCAALGLVSSPLTLQVPLLHRRCNVPCCLWPSLPALSQEALA